METSAQVLLILYTCGIRRRRYFCKYRRQKSVCFGAIQPGEAKENWRIIRALSENLGYVPDWSDLKGLRAELFKETPLISKIGMIIETSIQGLPKTKRLRSQKAIGVYNGEYYLSNIICRASKTMGKLAMSRRPSALEKDS